MRNLDTRITLNIKIKIPKHDNVYSNVAAEGTMMAISFYKSLLVREAFSVTLPKGPRLVRCFRYPKGPTVETVNKCQKTVIQLSRES